MINIILLIGALLGLTSLGAAAYVDHVLSHILDLKTLGVIAKALHYHQLYAIVISAIGLCLHLHNSFLLRFSAWIFIIGASLFCFSIYTATITGMPILLKMTPVGGSFLMLGWCLLAYFSIRYSKLGRRNDNIC